jgi:hypothetical protein
VLVLCLEEGTCCRADGSAVHVSTGPIRAATSLYASVCRPTQSPAQPSRLPVLTMHGECAVSARQDTSVMVPEYRRGRVTE